MAYAVSAVGGLYGWWVFNAEWTRGWIFLFAAIVIAIILGTWAGAVAGGKGRNTQLWFVLGFVLPVVGLVVIYILKPVKPVEGEKK